MHNGTSMAPGPRRLVEPLREAPASSALVALQVAALSLVTWRLGDARDPAVLVAAGALERGRVWEGQWWRLLSAVFLHVGWGHLALNAAFGLGWSRLVERAAGASRLLAVYLAAGVCASAASLLAQDMVSAGASGALFGLIGATLVLHRLALPGWRAFLASPLTVRVAGSLAAWTAVSLALRLPVDHAAHGGGLLGGAAVAAALSAPRARRAGWGLAAAAALAAVAAAAAWPRPELSRFAGGELERRGFEALSRGDAPAAAEAARRLEAGGRRTPGATLLRAARLESEGDLDGAAAAAREALAGEGAAPYRPVAARLLFRIGFRHYAGEGTPEDPARGWLLIREACLAGDGDACAAERQIRTGVPAPPR
jgi:membrane associated rhomboid family serine protease